MASYTYDSLKEDYDELLASYSNKPSKVAAIKSVAQRIYSNRERYKVVAKGIIPWQFIGVIHYLESNLDFNTHLHNGDPLTRRTRQVPRGRPLDGEPPFTWEFSAEDALDQKGLYQETDWSLPKMCYNAERYNGFGYRMRRTGVNSPYLWSGTTVYTRGKFVADGKYDRSEISSQIGCIPILQELTALEKTQTSRIADITDSSRKLGILSRVRTFIGTTVAGWFTMDNVPAAQQFASMAKEFTWNYSTYLLIGAGLATWVVCKYLEWLHLEDYKNGTYTPSKMTIPAADGEEH